MTITTKKQKEHSTLTLDSNALLPLVAALSANAEAEKIESDVNDEEFSLHPYSEDGLRVSEAVYWADYYEHPDFKYEWNNGVLEEKGMSNIDTSLLYDWFAALLAEYLKHHPIAQRSSLEIGGRIELDDEVLIRRPDLWIVLNSNPILPKGKDNSYHGTFDICIEAISKTKEKYKTKDTVDKKLEYALGGVKEYYILDGDGEETVFYRLNEQGEYEEIESVDGVIKSEVLPSFQFRISDLYNRPPIDELRHDEVYKHFVAVGWQASEEETQAEAEARRKEIKARKQAERKAEMEAEARRKETEARQAAEAEVERLRALLNKQNNGI